MTYNVDPKTGEVTLTPEQLVSSQYDVGMQNKKMERQAIKGLTPKYCYAGLANNWVETGSVGTIFFDRNESNDKRMLLTPPTPTVEIPAKGLYMISGTTVIQTTSTSYRYGLYVNKNGGDWGNGNLFYDVKRGDGGNLTLHTAFMAVLDQGDQITMTWDAGISSTLTFLADYTHLRVISYVLY